MVSLFPMESVGEVFDIQFMFYIGYLLDELSSLDVGCF